MLNTFLFLFFVRIAYADARFLTVKWRENRKKEPRLSGAIRGNGPAGSDRFFLNDASAVRGGEARVYASLLFHCAQPQAHPVSPFKKIHFAGLQAVNEQEPA
jgi:hypothetical protein